MLLNSLVLQGPSSYQQPVSSSAASEAVAPATAATSSATATPDVAGSVGVLRSAEPIDRLRYQAKLVFNHYDTDKDGKCLHIDAHLI